MPAWYQISLRFLFGIFLHLVFSLTRRFAYLHPVIVMPKAPEPQGPERAVPDKTTVNGEQVEDVVAVDPIVSEPVTPIFQTVPIHLKVNDVNPQLAEPVQAHAVPFQTIVSVPTAASAPVNVAYSVCGIGVVPQQLTVVVGPALDGVADEEELGDGLWLALWLWLAL